MPKVVISDTSTLIVLSKIDQLNILHNVYNEIITTPEVAKEFGGELPEWVIIQKVKDTKYQQFLSTLVDNGEASAFALAKEFDDVLILLDDLKARKLATRLNLKITGVLGILTKAKSKSTIKSIKPIIDKLIETDFRISQSLIEEVLRINNE